MLTLLTILNCDVYASYCDKLKEKYNRDQKRYTYVKYVSIGSEIKNVTIYWSNEKTRAASAILSVLLRYIFDYRNIHLHEEPQKLLQENEVMLGLSDPSKQLDIRNLDHKTEKHCNNEINYGLEQLHVYLPTEFRHLKQCIDVAEWRFYNNVTALKQCGFFNNISSGVDYELLLYKDTEKTNTTLDEFKSHIKAPNLILKVQPIYPDNLSILCEMTSNYSFLFIDDDIWSGYEKVNKVQLPKCGKNVTVRLNNTAHMHLTNIPLFIEYAPLIYQIAGYFMPSFESLNLTLQHKSIRLEAMTETTLENAACDWVYYNTEVKHWIPQVYDVYNIVLFISKDDYSLYASMLQKLITCMSNDHFITSFGITLRVVIDDDNVRYAVDEILETNSSCALRDRQRLLGAVVGSMRNLWEITNSADGANLPVLIYDGAGIDMKSKETVWHTSGTALHFTLALQKFIKDMNWTRITVLSESIPTAKVLYNELNDLGDLKLLEYSVQSNMSQLYVDKLFQTLKADDARIIFINTNYEDALAILSTATKLENKNNYVFIVRDWVPNRLTSNLTHISITFWPKNKNDIDIRDGWLYLRKEMSKVWRNKDWPIHATALVDAVLTLVDGFEAVFQKYPQTRNDIHSKLAMREFGRSLMRTPVKGTIQNLLFKDHTLEDTVVFVEEWNGEQRNMLANWQVYSTTRKVQVKYERRNYSDYSFVSDGAKEHLDQDIDYLYRPYWYNVLLGVLLTIPITFLVMLVYKMIRPRHYAAVSTQDSVYH